jgi:hypothetical protein
MRRACSATSAQSIRGTPYATQNLQDAAGLLDARTKDGASMLVRPDGCIAWTDASSKSLDDALARWFK